MKWENFFPRESKPEAVAGATSKLNVDTNSGILVLKSHFCDVNQTIHVTDYTKNCQIDTTLFDSCYSVEMGGCLFLSFIGPGSMVISRCCALNCFSNMSRNFLFSSFDSRNISSANVVMSSIFDCSNAERQEVISIKNGLSFISNYNNSYCTTLYHCAPDLDFSNSILTFMNIASNSAGAIVLFAAGLSFVSMTNFINNTETGKYLAYNGTICTKPNSLIRVVNSYIESGKSYLACSTGGQIIFSSCCLDHANTRNNATVISSVRFNTIEMTLMSTHGIRAQIPYREELCSSCHSKYMLQVLYISLIN